MSSPKAPEASAGLTSSRSTDSSVERREALESHAVTLPERPNFDLRTDGCQFSSWPFQRQILFLERCMYKNKPSAADLVKMSSKPISSLFSARKTIDSEMVLFLGHTWDRVERDSGSSVWPALPATRSEDGLHSRHDENEQIASGIQNAMFAINQGANSCFLEYSYTCDYRVLRGARDHLQYLQHCGQQVRLLREYARAWVVIYEFEELCYLQCLQLAEKGRLVLGAAASRAPEEYWWFSLKAVENHITGTTSDLLEKCESLNKEYEDRRAQCGPAWRAYRQAKDGGMPKEVWAPLKDAYEECHRAMNEAFGASHRALMHVRCTPQDYRVYSKPLLEKTFEQAITWDGDLAGFKKLADGYFDCLRDAAHDLVRCHKHQIRLSDLVFTDTPPVGWKGGAWEKVRGRLVSGKKPAIRGSSLD